ncbi:MAG: hypothetical protein AAF236_14020 [Verrucomicrobiota bacterium]
MKSGLLATVFLFCALSVAYSDIRIPSSVFTMEELDEAKAKAAEDEEPLIFVYTDPGTT